jgi:hypothetical protein
LLLSPLVLFGCFSICWFDSSLVKMASLCWLCY